MRRSYVDTLKTSKHYDQKHNVFLDSPQRGHTLDMYQLAPKHQGKGQKGKGRKRARSNRIISRSVAPLRGLELPAEAAEPAIQSTAGSR